MKKLKLTQGKFALVDDDWYEMLKHVKWSYGVYSKSGYAVNGGGSKGKNILMHRLIMDVNNPSDLVDHRNMSGTDNRRENLRICNKAENALNTKRYSDRYIGIRFRNGKYSVQKTCKKKRYYLGRYKNLKDAVKASNNFAVNKFGDWANLINHERLKDLGIKPPNDDKLS